MNSQVLTQRILWLFLLFLLLCWFITDRDRIDSSLNALNKPQKIALYDTDLKKTFIKYLFLEIHLLCTESERNVPNRKKDYIEETWQETDSGLTLKWWGEKSLEVWGGQFATLAFNSVDHFQILQRSFLYVNDWFSHSLLWVFCESCHTEAQNAVGSTEEVNMEVSEMILRTKLNLSLSNFSNQSVPRSVCFWLGLVKFFERL